jgi:hypothetical protein
MRHYLYMKILCLVCGWLLVASSASADEMKIWVISNPPGAIFYGIGRDGVEHSTLLPERIRIGLVKADQGCRELGPIRVQWMSSAEATLPSLRICKKTAPKTPIVFERPAAALGLEADVRFGLELEQRARQNVMNQPIVMPPPYIPPPPMQLPYMMQPLQQPLPQPVQCYSQLIGTIIYTTCQ